MLQTKSFKMDQGIEISDFLKKHQLANHASVFVSEGYVLIPYEDGEPLSKEQRAIVIKENIHRSEREMEVVFHDQKVLLATINNAIRLINEHKKTIASAEAQPNNKDIYETKKEAEEEIKRLKKFIEVQENIMVTNQAEITRRHHDLEVYKEELEAVENDLTNEFDPLSEMKETRKEIEKQA